MTALGRLQRNWLRVAIGAGLLLGSVPTTYAEPTCPIRARASETIADCTAFLKHNKDTHKQGPALRQRSMAYAMRGDLAHAMDDAHNAQQLDANDSLALVLLAVYTAEQQRFAEADALFNQAAAVAPNSWWLWVWRAAVEEGQRHYAKAAEDYTRSLELNPAELYALQWRAVDYARLGRCSLAILDDNQLLKSSPDNEGAILNRSYCEARQYNAAAAVDDATTVLKNVPNNAGAYADRARGYVEMGNYAAALADYARLKETHPKAPAAYLGPAQVHRFQGQDELAASEYRAVLAMDFPQPSPPPDPVVIEDNLLIMVRSFLTQSTGQPQHAAAHEGLAYLALQAGDLTAAKNEADHAVADEPKGASSYQVRGVVEFAQQQWAEAEADFARSVDNFPEYPYSALWRYLAAEHAGKDGKPDLLATMTQQTSADWPTPVGLYYLGKASEAEVFASAASAAGASDVRKQQMQCEADFYLGEAALLRGDTAEARRLFQAGVATGVRSFTEFSAAKRELQLLQ